MTTPHNFKADWFPFFQRCRICKLDRSDPIHPVTLKPLIQELHNAARRIDPGDRIVMDWQEVSRRIVDECDAHETAYNWIDRPEDKEYLACSKAQFIKLKTDHFFPLFRSALNFKDCDDHERWTAAWAAMLSVTASCRVHDMDARDPSDPDNLSKAGHIYRLFIHTDGVSHFDGALQTWIDPRRDRPFVNLFKRVRLIV
jgi:hypothetical protein